MLRITRAAGILAICVGLCACDDAPPPPSPDQTPVAAIPNPAIDASPGVSVEEPFEDPCPDSAMCRKHGACEFVDDDCRPTTTAHCAEAASCEEQGRCILTDGTCQATEGICSEWKHCPVPGTCGVERGRCVVTAAACAASADCRTDGRCGVVFGICAPTEEKHCKSSEACRRGKKCFIDRRGESARCGMDPEVRKSIVDQVNKTYGKKVRRWNAVPAAK